MINAVICSIVGHKADSAAALEGIVRRRAGGILGLKRDSIVIGHQHGQCIDGPVAVSITSIGDESIEIDRLAAALRSDIQQHTGRRVMIVWGTVSHNLII